MKKTIKYLQNGEYHYATVKDVGDIDLLKTSNKDDLVSAINEIIVNGVADGISQQDQLDKIKTDIRGVSADIAAKYLDLQSKISDGDATQASLRSQAIKDINGAIAAANAAIEEYKKANEEAVKATQADIDTQNNRIDRIDEQADALRTDLATAQTDLTKTKTDLSNAKLDFGKVKKTVVDLENEVSTKLSNTDLDPLNQKIQSVESNVKQTKDELSQYVKHDEYDLTTGEVNKIKSNVQQLADRVETKVSRDTLNDDINEFVVKKANLLVQTRDWSIIDNVGWTFSNDGLIAIQAELYDHAHVLELHQTGVYAEQTVKGLHGGQSYTVSVSAKTKDTASGVNVTLVGNNKTLGIMRRVKTHDTNISTEHERYEYTLVAPSDTLVLRFIATGMASSNVLYLYKAKLEEGTKSYEWEMNVNDIYAKVEKNSATLTTYDDRITGVVTKQRDFGTWKEQAQSTITQTADGLKINNQKLKNVNGDVVDVIQSKIDASAEKLTSNYEKFTNQQVGMIVDEGTNQILNSAFTYYDLDSKDVKKRKYTFDSWQNISAKATIKSINKVNWAHMAQSGLSNDNPISITSNTFPVKQGKVIVGVDVLTPNVRAIDNQKVLVLQFYDDNGTRVDYREVSLHDLGLDTIQSNVSKRGTYRVGIDRKDVTKMTILARLPRNGEINFTNFFAKVSSLDNGDYQPNPADLQQQTIKQQTAIEQTADTIRQKADQTTVDTLSGTVQRQGTLIEQNAQHIQLKADGTTVTALSNKTDELSQLVSKHSASLEVTDKAITQQASAISSVTTIANGANSKIDNLSFGGRNLLNGSSTLKIVAYSDVRDGTWRLSNQGNSTPLQNVTNELPPGVGVTNAIKISPLTGAAQDRASLSKGTYTFSVWLKGTAGMKYTLQPFWNPTATYGSSPGLTLQTSDWNRVSFTVDLKTDESIISTAYVYNHDKTNVLYMAAPQLEKASRPSDYSLSQNDLQRLASENTASQISQYNTGTVQPIKGIANDALGKANNANSKIDGLRIGGRNLLKGTSDQFKTISNSGWMWAHTWTNNDNNTAKISLANLHTGDYLTYSAWVINDSDVDVTPEITFFDKNVSNQTGTRGNILHPGQSGLVTNTRQIGSNDWYVRPTIISTNGQAGTHQIRIKEEMLTLGNVNLPWQPSDLDLPDTIVTTVTEVSNASQIVKSSGIYTEVNSVKTETTGKLNEVNNRVSNVNGRVDNVNNKIDNLKVGGKNLLDYSSFARVFDGSTGFRTKWYLVNSGYATWGFDSDVPFSAGDDRSLMVQIKSPGSDTARGIMYQSPIVKMNTEYTISFWAKARANDMKIEVESNAKRVQFNLSTSWQRYEGVITFQSDNRTLYIHNWQDGAVGQFLIFHPQLELGNKASDWSLSQNDVQKLASKDTASQINAFDTKNITPIKQTVTQYTNKTEELAGSVTHFMGAIGYDGTTFTDKFKTVVETAGGTKETYKALEGKINGIVVGGKNLLDGTATMGNNGVFTITSSSASNWSEGYVFAVKEPTQDGEQYILSFDAMASTDKYVMQNHWYYGGISGSNNPTKKITDQDGKVVSVNGDGATFTTLTTSWKRYWYLVDTRNSGGETRIIIGRLNDRYKTGPGWVKIRKAQLEKGNKPSDWGMSDNDIKAKVAEVKKAADNNATSLTEYKRTVDNTYAKSEDVFSSVTKEDFKNIIKNATFLKTADGFETTVKSRVRPLVEGGGVNLMRNTTKDYVKFTGSGWAVGYPTSNQQAVEVATKGGETYTFSAWVKNDSSSAGRVDLEIYQYNAKSENKQNGSSSEISAWVSPGEEKRLVFTKTLLADTTRVRLHTRNRDNNGTVTYWTKMAKVEKGTIATPWSPYLADMANEDYVNQHISTAKSDVTELINNKTRDISKIKQTADKVSISVGKMFGKSDASSLDVDANGIKLKGKLLQLDGDVTIAPGFQLKADYIKSGTLNTNNLIMKHPQGSTVTFTQDGFDVQKSDNREAFYTIGGDGIDFWRMTEGEAMNDYPAHFKPGYAHLGSLVALDNSYTKSTRRVDRLQQGVQQNKVSNDNGIGFIIDVTGGSDTFSILQKGAEYRNGDRSGRINFNDTVNNSHFPIWEVNATGFRSLSYPQSGYMHGRGILHYTNTYFYTDPVMGNEHNQSGGVNYHPSQRLGYIGNNGWGDFAITADNNNTMAVGAGSHNQNVWVNGFIFGSQNGADRIFGYDGSQWIDLVNKRTTRDNGDVANHFANLHLWELQYNTLTHTSQLSKKTDIEPLDTKDFASKILSIDLYKYRYKNQDKNEKDNYGAIIDDVNKEKKYNLPQEFITTRDKGINDSHLITGLIATVQEQAKQIEQLSFRILELERGASVNG